MAQKVLYVLTDDLDQSEAAETVAFGLDSVSYELDLSAANAQRLRDLLAPYVAVSRRVGGARRSRTGGRRRGGGGAAATDIRTWAQEQGLTVSARGRVPADIREAYDKAHR
ncbi:MAG: Lsr2 family protein [Micropruina sp.]|nr:MAG: Lsr2 family protein [Micropruina sp.]